MKTKTPPLNFVLHTPNFTKELLANNKMGILKIPMNIFRNLLGQVADRAAQLEDPELSLLMCKLTLFEEADPDSKNYNPKLIAKLERLVAKRKLKKPL